MDASYKIQKSIHVLQLAYQSMCPGFRVHIICGYTFRCSIEKLQRTQPGLSDPQ